jgi:hypothetical protein
VTERPVAIRAVFFGIGETLVDETRRWGAWADALEVPRTEAFLDSRAELPDWIAGAGVG